VDTRAGCLLRVGHNGAGRTACATYGGSANAITLSTGGSLPSLPTGPKLRFVAIGATTGAATVAVDGLAAVPLKTVTGAALPHGYIRAGVVTEMVFDGTNFLVSRAVETGTNADGRFRRWKDGTMTCLRLAGDMTGPAVATNGVYAPATCAFPAASVGGAAQYGNVAGYPTDAGDNRCALAFATEFFGTSGGYSVKNLGAVTITRILHLTMVAHGRW